MSKIFLIVVLSLSLLIVPAAAQDDSMMETGNVIFYHPDGTLKDAVLPKFIALSGSDDMLRELERYFYRGVLLTGREKIYYLNATVGALIAMSADGKIRAQRNITEDMGPSGMYVQERVREYLKDPDLILKPDRYLAHMLFSDACFANGKIYILRWVDGDIKSTRKDIVVIDGNSLEVIERIHFRMQPGEFVWSFVVHDTGSQRNIYLSMDTDQDTQIVALVP